MIKKILLLGLIATPLISMAGVSTPPANVKYIPEMYALKVSPNGEWIGNRAGDTAIYNNITGESVEYVEVGLGIGNSIANSGLAVGDINDRAAILYNGEIIQPEELMAYWFCDINAITPDGSRICGIVNTETGNQTFMRPFVAEINEIGNVVELMLLPYPKEDLLGYPPQYCTAVWISDDGQTVLGQVTDWSGQVINYPIVYTQDDNGEWEYSLPTESLFNPGNIYIPENPALTEPEYPEPENFMSGLRLSAYQQAYENWEAGLGEEPDPLEYMSEEQQKRFMEVFEFYNLWWNDKEAAIKEYNRVIAEVKKASPSFGDNASALHPSGDYFMTLSILPGENDEPNYSIYRFNTRDKGYQKFDSPEGRNYFPTQVLPDGTTLLSLPRNENPSTYMLLPGKTEFVSFSSFLQPDYPEIVSWLKDNFPAGDGWVTMSYDMSVITGALTDAQFGEKFDDINGPLNSTYILNDLQLAGIDEIAATNGNDGVYRVFNLQGVKVMETKDSSVLNSLPKGIYIVNGKKVIK